MKRMYIQQQQQQQQPAMAHGPCSAPLLHLCISKATFASPVTLFALSYRVILSELNGEVLIMHLFCPHYL